MKTFFINLKNKNIFFPFVLITLIILITACFLLPMEPGQYIQQKLDISLEPFFPRLGDNVTAQTTITWGIDSRIQLYHIQVSTDIDFPDSTLIADDDTLTTGSYPITLDEGNTYYWRLRFKMDDKWETWYTPIKFNATREPFNTEGFELNDGSFSTLNNWDLQGDSLPFIQSNYMYSGTYAVQFGDIEDFQYSLFQITVLLASTKTLSFWYKVDSESCCDMLLFYSNDETLLSSASNSWAYYSITLDAGEYIFVWKYNKDGSVSNGLDTAWVDDISIF